MSNRSAKFAPILLVGMIAGGTLIAMPPRAASAADSCQTGPDKNQAAQGKHWYYRLEHGTGRHCWYLREQDEKSARADTSSAASPAPTEKSPSPQTDAATSRSIANAHAELRPQAPATGDTNAAAASPAWPNPVATEATNGDAAAPTSAVAARWPQSSGVTPSANQRPAASPPEASLMVADAQPDASADDSSSTSTAPPSPAATPSAATPEQNAGSLQKLLLVVLGALALAGLTGSAIFRLARRRRLDDWQRERTNWQSADNPRHPPWAHAQPDEPNHAVAELDPPDLAPQYADFQDDLEEAEAPAHRVEPADRVEPVDRVEQIEDFLARLTRQLQTELESPRAQ